MENLGKYYQDNENIVIAKFDPTSNEAAGVDKILVFPKFKFYPIDQKNGYDYDGERELEGFKKWLKENSPLLMFGDELPPDVM